MAEKNDPLPSIFEDYKDRLEEFERAEVKCGITGTSGSGKSSLINAIAGERIADVGVVETTDGPQPFKREGLTFVDLPGCGTPRWPRETYFDRLDLGSYDCFLLITADRFRENDLYLYREIVGRGLPCFVIRNKFDRAVEDARHDHSHNEEEVRAVIEKNILESLHPDPPRRVYLTSARHPERFDLPQLLDDISDQLDGIKRDRFIADMGAYSQEALDRKKNLAEKRVKFYAVAAAANGANPVPGVDIAADIALLMKMAKEIASIYGLTDEHVDFLKVFLGPKKTKIIAEKLTQFASKYLLREGVVFLLKRTAKRQAAKTISKWVPILGHVTAAAIGAHACHSLGTQLIEEAEEIAVEMLDAIAEASTESLAS